MRNGDLDAMQLKRPTWYRSGMVEKETKLEDEVILKVDESVDVTVASSSNVPKDDDIGTQEKLVGTTFADHYMIESVLGTGGMSSVYKAEHLLMHCHRAIKVLKSNDTTDRGAKDTRRFQQEAKAICSLEHDHIVRVHEFGIEHRIEKPYLVMDLVDGQSLQEIVKTEGKLTEDRALILVAQIADALKHAHSHGVIHRDIKPANVIVAKTASGEECKIVDFGIAKLSRSEDGPQSLTQTGDIFGSPLYMSPEQCLGHKVDHRSDLYSLGCLFYELLTGNPPHKGQSSLETLHLHLVKDPEQAAASVAVRAILDKLLKKDARERYQDAESLLEDLKRVIGESPAQRNSEQPPSGSIPTPGTPGLNSFRRNLVISSILFSLTGVVAIFMITSTPVSQNPPATQNGPAVSAPGKRPMIPLAPYDTRFLFDGPVLPLHESWGKQLKDGAVNRIRAAEASTADTRAYQLREAHREYADLLLKDGETDQALAEYDRALAAWTQFGGDDEALKPAIGAGDALMDKSNYSAAFDRYLKVLDDLDRRNIHNTLNRGNVLLKLGVCKAGLGDAKSANQYINEAIECLKPLLSSQDKAQQISARVLTGDALLMFNRPSEAAVLFESAAKISEDAMHDGMIMSNDNVWIMRLKMAEAYSLAGDTVKAERALQRVLSDSGIDMPHHRELKARVLYALAMSYSITSPTQAKDKFEAALAEAEKIPDSPALLAMIKRGLSSKLLEDPQRAKRLYEESNRLMQQHPAWSPRPLVLEQTVQPRTN